jgi:aspartyl protease family protein
MALSSGARQAATVAAGWAAAAAAVAVGLVYFSELKAITGPARIEQPARAADQLRPSHAGPHIAQASRGRIVELKAGAFGHFHTRAEINGRPIGVMVDSGASMVAMTYEDAREAGFFVRDSDFTHQVNTANGTARVAPVTIDRISIGDITVRNVPGAVLEAGKLGTTLLGMSFLSRLQRVDMRSGMLVLQE